MDILLDELKRGLPDTSELARVILRLIIAMLLGALVGFQRARTGKPAGLRTHMLVAMGAALLVLAPLEFGFDSADLSRVIQGLVSGIGFLGAGAILKLADEHQIHGLTTAAGIWMTAAVGVTVGLGLIGLALVSVVLTWLILSALSQVENRMAQGKTDQKNG